MKRFINWLLGEPSAADAVIERLRKEQDRLVTEIAANQETLQRKVEMLLAENQALKAALRCPFEPREVDSAPPWTQDDAERWRLFLTCETGDRLKRLLNFWSQWEEQAATLREDNFENACGQAKGFRRCAQYALQKLSADIRPQQDEDTQGQHGAADLRERYAP